MARKTPLSQTYKSDRSMPEESGRPEYGSTKYAEELARAQLAESEAKLKLAKALKQRDMEIQKVSKVLVFLTFVTS